MVLNSLIIFIATRLQSKLSGFITTYISAQHHSNLFPSLCWWYSVNRKSYSNDLQNSPATKKQIQCEGTRWPLYFPKNSSTTKWHRFYITSANLCGTDFTKGWYERLSTSPNTNCHQIQPICWCQPPASKPNSVSTIGWSPRIPYHHTSPDIAFNVNKLWQSMHNPMLTHFKNLHYPKGTSAHGLSIALNSLTLTAFCNLDWAGDSTDRKSTTSYCVLFGDVPISWTAKK